MQTSKPARNIRPRGTLSGLCKKRGGESVKIFPSIRSRSLLCAAAGILTVVMVAGSAKPAAAQASDAADRCTPDVMRLCSEFIPDADRIVVCLKAKRRQLSPSCLTALQGGSGKAKKRRARKEG
jgi:hypothetical protein